nr:hypothetical protein KXZ65_21065 [Pectobacterium sp. PL152]
MKPETDLISKVKSKTMSMPAILYSQEQVEQHDDSSFIINVSKDILGDSSGIGSKCNGGNFWCWRFLKTHQYLILTGIVTSIPDEGMLAKVVCSNANGFLSLESSLKAYNDSDYNYGRDVVIDSINIMRKEILDSTIDEWENNEKNIEYANNINRKLSVLHNKTKLDLVKEIN